MGGKCGRGLAPDSGGSVTNAVTDTQPSGASSLPHLICVRPPDRSALRPPRFAFGKHRDIALAIHQLSELGVMLVSHALDHEAPQM
ncbi:hypothetical protein CQZ99_26045 [Pseudomonas poae]|uniref:Uncharacterized protein n=1 Tax=Pseudomonas poae TaxID=200451 RepID=A0A2S9E8X1_9PSED|nr:hypothetical protein CQZ97_27320 [Pseudomonas poae]PRC11274.1 hypothetical protein CQZ99_26045 [Pseudomonas poae]